MLVVVVEADLSGKAGRLPNSFDVDDTVVGADASVDGASVEGASDETVSVDATSAEVDSGRASVEGAAVVVVDGSSVVVVLAKLTRGLLPTTSFFATSAVVDSADADSVDTATASVDVVVVVVVVVVTGLLRLLGRFLLILVATSMDAAVSVISADSVDVRMRSFLLLTVPKMKDGRRPGLIRWKGATDRPGAANLLGVTSSSDAEVVVLTGAANEIFCLFRLAMEMV